MKKKIAIIGYGRFGRLAGHYLKKHFDVFAADVIPKRRFDPGVRRISIQKAATMEYIVLAVPIHSMPSVLRAIKPSLQPGALILDVASVKEQPIRWMKSVLPDYVSILGTHPLFGPESAGKELQGRTIVLCPVRIAQSKLMRIKRSLKNQGLIVQQMSPQKHDRIMASTLFLTQFTCRGLKGLKLPPSTSGTLNYRVLHTIISSTERDTKELFHDMFRYNRYARPISRKIITSFQKLTNLLEK